MLIIMNVCSTHLVLGVIALTLYENLLRYFGHSRLLPVFTTGLIVTGTFTLHWDFPRYTCGSWETVCGWELNRRPEEFKPYILAPCCSQTPFPFSMKSKATRSIVKALFFPLLLPMILSFMQVSKFVSKLCSSK